MPTKTTDIQYLDKKDFPLWDELVKNSLQGTFFCESTWLQILEEVYNRPLKMIVCKRNQEIVAGIPFFENKKLFWKLITPVFLLPFNGPIFKSSQDTKPQKIIADQIEYVKDLLTHLEEEYKLIQLNTHQNLNDFRAFKWRDFQTEPEHTYICKLEKWQTLVAGFNQSLRKKIQKAKDHGYEFFQSDDIDLFSDLYLSSYKRHGKIPPISIENFKILILKIIALPNVNLYLIKKEETVLAGRIVLEDKETIYDLLAGNNDETGLASPLLVAEIMKNYTGKFRYFDFMGADHPEIEKFKRAFGGKLVNLFRVNNSPGFIFDLILKVRQKREIRRRTI